jgi:hypothetical protein
VGAIPIVVSETRRIVGIVSNIDVVRGLRYCLDKE